MKISAKSLLQFVIMLGIGLLLIWLIYKQVEPEKERIIPAFKNADYFWVGVSMVVAFLSHFLRAYRWNYLLEPLGHKTTLVNATCHVIIGYFANYGIPRMGEVSRCTLAARYDKVPFEIGFGTVITERIVDTLLFILIFFLTLLLQFEKLIGLANTFIFDKLRAKFGNLSQSPIKLALLIAFVVIVIGALFFLRKRIASMLKGKIGSRVAGMLQGIGSIRKMKRPIQFVLLSLAIWACYFYSLYACFFALEGTAGLGQSACLTLLLFGTFGVIFSPGGIGAYPAILFVILNSTFGVDTASSFALPWLSWTGQFILVVSLGLLCLALLPIINKTKKDNGLSPAIEK